LQRVCTIDRAAHIIPLSFSVTLFTRYATQCPLGMRESIYNRSTIVPEDNLEATSETGDLQTDL